MTYLLALLLGLVQGVAEFLPISSSGHLTLADALLQRVFGDSTQTLSGPEFTIAVHVGTLGSIVVVYWRRLLEAATNVRLIGYVVLATLPVVGTGLLAKDLIDDLLSDPIAVGFALCVTGVLLALIGVVERRRGTVPPPPSQEDEPPPPVNVPSGVVPSGRTMETMTWRDALVVGLMQAIAPVPGISRSGSTIFAGVLAGMDRRAAADFSFFIAIPAIAGAAVMEVKDVVEKGELAVAADVLFWGATVAFVTGLVALKVLLAIVAKGQLNWFAAYCLAVGVGAVAWFGLGG